MSNSIDVVICTHNPKKKYLSDVLNALRVQTLSLDQWNLLIVDNANDQSVFSGVDIAWHPNARMTREERLGLTYARLRAIQETESELLVFVDDDNVLADNYLENVLQISENWPILGVWGGQCIARFEEEPPPWSKPYWGLLTVREFNNDRWTNVIDVWDATPVGAGMCVRRPVVEVYSKLLYQNPKRLMLGRKGNLLNSSEDIDLAHTACDIGLGMGLFSCLKLYHLISPHRLEESYLIKLVEGLSYSTTILDSFRGDLPEMTWLSRLKILMPWLMNPKLWMMKSRDRRFLMAQRKGRLLAMQDLHKVPSQA